MYYIILDPSCTAACLPQPASAKQCHAEKDYEEPADSPFGEDIGLLEDISRITEPYSSLFAELEGFESLEPLQTELPCPQFSNPHVLTPPASPPNVNDNCEIYDNCEELFSVANDLISLRSSPIEFEVLFKSVEAEVCNSSDYEEFSPYHTCASPDTTDYEAMSPEQIYGSPDTIMSESSYEDGSSPFVTISQDYTLLISDPDSFQLQDRPEEHSYSRPCLELPTSTPASVAKERKTAQKSRAISVKSKPIRSKFSAEDRRLRKKEQNKQAAIRYRQKKKDEQNLFAKHEKELVQVHRSLSRDANNIRAEIRIVKNIMRDHFKAKGLL